MAYIGNVDKILQAVLADEELMKFGKYSHKDIGNIYQALESDNVVINTVAQIIKRTKEEATTATIWKEINTYLKRNL